MKSRYVLVAILCVLALAFVVSFAIVRTSSQSTTDTIKIGDTMYTAEYATTPYEQAQGLSGRSSMPERHALVFPYSQPTTPSFWMKDMLFAIDIVWVRDGVVVAIDTHVQPEPGVPLSDLQIYSPDTSIDTVIEIRAGEVEQNNIQVGDRVIID